MKKFSMQEAQPLAQREDRAKAEIQKQNAVIPNGHERLKLGKTKQVIFRVTPEKHAQLVRLADALSTGRKPISLTETMEKALDVLEARLKGSQ